MGSHCIIGELQQWLSLVYAIEEADVCGFAYNRVAWDVNCNMSYI
jgi:hypothetical protein